MSNQIIPSLFILIQRMSKTEKRHFKLYARSHSPNTGTINYLQLFDLIAKQNKYDEEKIIKQNIVKKEHMPMLKNYLFNLILENLRIQRSNRNDIDCQLNNLIEGAFIMREKGIEKEEYKLWEKAKQMAFRHERWGYALHVLLMQSEKITRDQNVVLLGENENEIKSLIEKVENLLEYKKIRREAIQLLMGLDPQKSVRNNKEVEKILNYPLIRNEKNGMSAAAVMEGHFTRLQFRNIMEDYTGTLKAVGQLLNFIESNYSKLDFAEYHYAVALCDMASSQLGLGKYKEAFLTMQKHKGSTLKSLTTRDYVFIASHDFELNYYLITGEFKRGIITIRKMENQMKKIKMLIHYRQIYILYFNASSIFFLAGEYKDALHWIRKITNPPIGAGPCREDIRAWAHLVTILIHYEKKTPDILDHLTTSTRHFMNKRARLYKVEETVLRFMHRLNIIEMDKKNLRKEFQNFRNELIRITKDPKEQKALIYFDLFSWVESKIENKSFAAVVQEKASQQTST